MAVCFPEFMNLPIPAAHSSHPQERCSSPSYPKRQVCVRGRPADRDMGFDWILLIPKVCTQEVV